MSLNSFRLKIALLSGLITGLLLVAAGVFLWQLAYRIELARIDREIRNLVAPHLERVLGGDHWVRFEDALRFVAGTNAAPAFILWVQDEDRVLHQSPNWPVGLVPDSFLPLTSYETAEGPQPGQPLPPPPRRGEEISKRNPPLPRKASQFYTRQDGGKTWRIGVMGNPYMTIILGTDINEFNAGMAQLRRACLLALPVALLLVGLGAWFLAARALRPVTALTRMAESVTIHGLDQRIPTMTHDQEFNRLITVVNAMLNRLETSFQQATRFSADASHELKTPLARLQAELEQALQTPAAELPPQQVYGSLLEEIHRLKSIIQKLLLLALADAGRLQLKLLPTDLSAMLANVIEDCQAQAPALTIEPVVPANIRVNADAELLEQALQNLASNALKYNREGGAVRFALTAERDRVLVRVANTGPQIPAADRELIFERFHRADPARSGNVEGVGLGLSLAREIVRAHHGDLVLESSDAQLTTFALTLPACPPAFDQTTAPTHPERSPSGAASPATG